MATTTAVLSQGARVLEGTDLASATDSRVCRLRRLVLPGRRRGGRDGCGEVIADLILIVRWAGAVWVTLAIPELDTTWQTSSDFAGRKQS